MKTFEVQLGYSSIVSMEIKARNKGEAILKARKERSNLFDEDLTQWQDDILYEIEPWEDADTAEEV